MKKSTSYIYSIIGISLVLFLLGTIGWLFLNGQALAVQVKENFQLQVIMQDNTRPEMAKRLEAILQKQPFAKAVTYTSKEDALKQFIAEKDENPMANGLLTENPLYISVDVNLRHQYVNADSLALVSKFLQQSNIVREVVYNKIVVESLDKNLRRIGIVLGIIAVVLLLAVIIIIDNTVRLAMFSNRILIKTMQMVGATRWFIARPFDMKAISTGFISGLLAVAALLGLRYAALHQIPELNALANLPRMVVLCAIIILLGVFISLISTHRSVFKYLKLKVESLY